MLVENYSVKQAEAVVDALQVNLTTLPSIKNLINSKQIRANRALGQNFILDTDVTDKIIIEAPSVKGESVLEIGGGVGTLTRSLLSSEATKIFVIEKDERCKTILDELIPISDGRLEVLHADALTFDENTLCAEKLYIIANLPYNIGTKLVLKWLHNLEKFGSITVMLQKDVAQRLAANPCTSSYGSLSILTQWLCKVEILFDVLPEVFHPAPKVVSSVINLIPRDKPLYDCEKSSLELVCRTAFNMRRKTIKKSLKVLLGQEIGDMLLKLNISPRSRPEELTIEEFAKIAALINF